MSEHVVESRRELNLGRMQYGMLFLGGILLLVAIAMMMTGMRQTMLQSYLWAWVFWGGLTFGCFAMTLLHHSLKGS